MNRDQIRDIEAQLDAALLRRPIYGSDANAALMMAANVAEAATVRFPDAGMSGALNRGTITFAPHLVSGKTGANVQIDTLVEDLLFGSHYHMVRDFIYYTYGTPDAVEWAIKPGGVEIRFRDRTIPHQFFSTMNDAVLGSIDHFAKFNAPDELRRLLKGAPEFEITDAHRAAEPFLCAEVDHKLAAYFSILDAGAEIDLGGYNYSQFHAIYRNLLMKALYHRYHAEVNNIVGGVHIDSADLERGFAEEVGIDPAITRLIMDDIAYDAKAGKTDASYFSLHREGALPKRFIMRPHHFSCAEGLVQLLRVVAHRRPRHFLKNVSNTLGSRFVQRAKSAFERQGFVCHSEVSLRRFDVSLPDIDLLVISEEPTLGYVLLVCEVKSPLPPMWAKDQLRALQPDNISKSFRQAESLTKFLTTQTGVAFLRDLLPKGGIPHFDGFVALIKTLVITSNNAGMFFGSEKTPIFSFRTLERLLRRSDGDMALILEVLSTYPEKISSSVRTEMQTFTIDEFTISYEAVVPSILIDFPQGEWRSSPIRQQVIDSFIADGHHPFDSLHEIDNLIVAVPGSAIEEDSDEA